MRIGQFTNTFWAFYPLLLATPLDSITSGYIREGSATPSSLWPLNAELAEGALGSCYESD